MTINKASKINLTMIINSDKEKWDGQLDLNIEYNEKIMEFYPLQKNVGLNLSCKYFLIVLKNQW